MPLYMPHSKIGFIMPNSSENELRLDSRENPMGEPLHKKRFSSTVNYFYGGVIFNKFNQFNPAFQGDRKDSVGYFYIDCREKRRLDDIVTPLGVDCRIVYIAGETVRYRVSEVRPAATLGIWSDTEDAEPSLYLVFFKQDSEEIGGSAGVSPVGK